MRTYQEKCVRHESVAEHGPSHPASCSLAAVGNGSNGNGDNDTHEFVARVSHQVVNLALRVDVQEVCTPRDTQCPHHIWPAAIVAFSFTACPDSCGRHLGLGEPDQHTVAYQKGLLAKTLDYYNTLLAEQKYLAGNVSVIGRSLLLLQTFG